MQRDPISPLMKLAKPVDQETYARSVIIDLQRRGMLIGTRKRDGHKMIAEICASGRIRLYTSSIHQIDDRLDYIREEIRALGLREGTLLIGELVVEMTIDARLTDHLGSVSRILRASRMNVQKSLAQGLLPVFFVFNVMRRDTHDVIWEAEPYGVTLGWLQRTLRSQAYVRPIEDVRGSFKDMRELSLREGWEGLVLYDRGYQITYKSSASKGTEPRPDGCYKFKHYHEGDFFVIPSGRRFHDDGRLKDVMLLQWDGPQKLKRVNCGRLGAFTKSMRGGLTWMIDPKVLQVSFRDRNPGTGKLREPKFIRLRNDKSPAECIAPRSWLKIQYV